MSQPPDDPHALGGPPPSDSEWFRYDPDERRASGGSVHSDDDLSFVHRSRVGPPERRRRRGRLVGLALVAILALLFGVGAGYARGYFSSSAVGEEVTVVIAAGDSLSTIADRLEAAGVVEHAGAFVVRAKSDGYSSQLKAGTYRLRENEPYAQLVTILVEGQEPLTLKVTIPEGSTLKQSATIVAKSVESVETEDYIRIARDDPPRIRLEGYKTGTTLEGLLFPATYEPEPDVKAKPFIERQLAAFEKGFAEVDMRRAGKANLTPYDVVIIASMVEREAQVDEERPLVAAVIWNRLQDDMLLQIDATIQYALGETKPVLTFDDLKIDSPYNTYKNAGLPPTPIANPGLASLQAAADPAAVVYRYYVARADGTGKHYFSRTYEEFLANQAKAVRNSQ